MHIRFGQIIFAWVLSHVLGTFLPKSVITPPLVAPPAVVIQSSQPLTVQPPQTLESAADRLRQIKKENDETRAKLDAAAKDLE